MGCGSSTSEKYIQYGSPDEIKMQKRISKKIDMALKEQKKLEERTLKLLLLGIGESGKSTITKQMKIIHINGFDEQERLSHISAIRKNLKDSILTIVGAMDELGIQLADKENTTSKEFILRYADDKGAPELPQEFYDHSLKLWTDLGIQKAFSRSSEYQLIDSAKYFLDQIDKIRRDDYIPSDQDILRCRVITTGIIKIDFTLKADADDVNFSVFDVGGQQGERRKWIQVFESCTAVLFLADISSFDLQLREDETKNRLIESLDIFKQTWNNRFLQNVSIILFLNKMDILEEKVNSGTSLQTLADKISEDSPYYAHLQNFRNYTPTDNEVREFIEAQPTKEDSSGPKINDNTTRPRSRSRGSSISRKADINFLKKSIPNSEVIKTAAFIKNMYMTIVHSERKMSSHESHFCRYFYTCAVDTDNVRKVLDGCRSIIIQTWLDKIFVLG